MIETTVLAKPLTFERSLATLEDGLTITQLLDRVGIPADATTRVYIDGVLIYPEFYHVTRPKRGRHVFVRVVPRGTGGGNQTQKNIGMVLTGWLLTIVGAVFLATGYLSGAGAPLVVAGIGLILSGVLNALLPAPKPKGLDQLAGALAAQTQPESPSLSLAGADNGMRPWAPVPRVFGRYRIFPPYAARPYTEIVGADQYLRLLFCVGLGPTDVTDLRIGDTAIEAYDDVEVEIRAGDPGEPPITLYTSDVAETPLSVVLLASAPQIRTSEVGAIELSVSWAYPQGLVQFDASSGAKLATSVSVDVDYRLTGGTSWTAAPGSPVVTTDARQGLTRDGLRWPTPEAGQYDVRLTRTTADSADPLLHNASIWTALRTFRASPAVVMTGLALVALRIKATDQLNGVVNDFSCLAFSRHLDYADYAGSVLADRPVGYWRLGEPTGAPTAFDGSGHGRPGVYSGGPTRSVGLIVSDSDTAMTFNGVDDAVRTFTGLSTLDFGATSFTLECVVRTPTVAAGTAGIAHKGAGDEFGSGGLGWALRRNGNLLQFCRGSGVGSPTVLQAGIAVNTTYHVVIRYDLFTGTADLWLNGVKATTDVFLGSAVYADTYGLDLGQTTDGFFSGTLDEVALYMTALPGARVTAHWSAQQGFREWVVQHTSNPASIYREILQGRNNARPVPDSRLDLAALEAWHGECASGGRSCNLVLDYPSTLYELLRVVAACGRGTPSMSDGKFSVVRDVPQTVPVQLFTPRNSRNFQGRHALPDLAHAVKVKFVDPGADWQQVERMVYADGFDASNATIIETLEFPGVTDPDLAWRLGRYHLAASTLRRATYDLETDVEYLACQRGDLVHVNHDVTEWGIAAGRITSIVQTGGALSGVTVDEALTMEAGHAYQLRARLSDGSTVVGNVVTVAGAQTSILFDPVIAAPHPEVGDLVAFGEATRESIPCLVTMIRPGPDLSAALSLVDAAPAVLLADQFPLPAWDPQITLPIDLNMDPPTPIIASIVSDETVLSRDLDGSLHAHISLTFDYKFTSNTRADFLELRIRRSVSRSPYRRLAPLPADTTTATIDLVEEGLAYDLGARTVNRDGRVSPWVEIQDYVVVGKTSAPPVPLNLRLETDRLAWDYPTPPLDLLGFELRRGPGTAASWDTALEMHVGTIAASPFILPAIFNQWTFLLAAIDTSGNASSPVSLTIDFGDPRLHNLVESYDYRANSWPGTVTNGALAAGDLKADQLTTGFWTLDGNTFWSTVATTLFWQGTYKQMVYVFTFTPAAGSAGARLVFEHTVLATGYTFEWKKGSLPYAPFPGTLENIEAVAHTFRITTDASIVQGIISELKLYIDADTLSEQQSSVVTAVTTGTRLTLQQSYRGITNVQVTVVASGAETARSAVAADKQNTAGANNGPLIKAYDASGLVVAGHVDVVVTGY